MAEGANCKVSAVAAFVTQGFQLCTSLLWGQWELHDLEEWLTAYVKAARTDQDSKATRLFQAASNSRHQHVTRNIVDRISV